MFGKFTYLLVLFYPSIFVKEISLTISIEKSFKNVVYEILTSGVRVSGGMLGDTKSTRAFTVDPKEGLFE